MSLYQDVHAVYEQYMNEANTYAQQFGLDPRTSTDGEWDAFRHAYASAAMTMEYNEQIAHAFGELNEIKGDIKHNQSPEARNMDEWNNAIGRQIGDTATSKNEIADRVYQQLQNGGLITSKSDTRQYSDIVDDLIGDLDNDLDKIIEDFKKQSWSDFTGATEWRRRRDPLVLDLDGDGVELVAESGAVGVMFDHDGDGIANATQWVGADDGFLVIDRNGDGVIDNGGELFGDSTPTASGGTAQDGFAALADYDSNGDGAVNASDANFSQLQIWRDLNQDGVSQGNELMTLAQAGIAQLNVASTPVTNNPDISATGSFIRTDGSTGTMVDATLTENSFVSESATPVPLSAAAALPTLDGSGWVRDLNEAVTLDTSGQLQTLLAQYSNATTRAQTWARAA
jgi:hypothetical protein